MQFWLEAVLFGAVVTLVVEASGLVARNARLHTIRSLMRGSRAMKAPHPPSTETGELLDAAQELLAFSGLACPRLPRNSPATNDFRAAWLHLQAKVKAEHARRILVSADAGRVEEGFALRELSRVGREEDLSLVEEYLRRVDLDYELRALAEEVEEKLEGSPAQDTVAER